MKCIALFILMPLLALASINHVHIPKCGGTTVNKLLDANFQKNEIYPHGKLEKGRAVYHLPHHREEVQKEFPRINHKLVRGHFTMWFFADKDPSFDSSFFFTVLRDPVERVLSHDRDRMRGLGKKKGTPAVSAPLHLHGNMMCSLLAMEAGLTGEALLESAKRGLDRMDYIIFMDEFEGGLRTLFSILGLHLPKAIPHRNTTETSLKQRQNITPKLLEEIREKNSLDIALYKYAYERWHR